MSKNFDALVGLIGVGVGLVGVGYALGTRSKMARISEKLDRSIEDLAGQIPVDIPKDIIERATEKAIACEVKGAVGKVTDAVTVDLKRDIHKKVTDAVESEYANVKESVLEELVSAASKINVKRVREDVENAAKKHALEKFDDNLDDILGNFNDQLKNTSRIYTSIADTMGKYGPNDREAVIRIGR